LDLVPLLKGGLLCTDPSPAFDIRKEKRRKEKKREDYAFWHQQRSQVLHRAAQYQQLM